MSFLIELRMGTLSWKLKRTTKQIGHKYHIPIEEIPHLTLYGPFSLKPNIKVKDLTRSLDQILNRCGNVPFSIDGFEIKKGQNGWVMVYKIAPSDTLNQLRKDIILTLPSVANTKNTWDQNPNGFWHHITIANHLEKGMAKQILKEIQKDNPAENKSILKKFFGPSSEQRTEKKIYPLYLNHESLRLTVLSNAKVVTEYDLLRKTWLTRSEALDRAEWNVTLRNYRKRTDLQIDHPKYSSDDIFLTGNTHFGHPNIIHYCCRPFGFRNVDEMDRVLINNWNNTVQSHNSVYILGNFKYGYQKPFTYYWNRLNGNKILIRGNPDEKGKEFHYLDYGGYRFLLIHNPKEFLPIIMGGLSMDTLRMTI